MDQIGNICRCHCHSTFLGEPPEWKCYCNCPGKIRKDNKIDMNDLLERVEFVERALENYREYKTGIEDLGTDVMYIKERLTKIESHFSGDYQLIASKLMPHKCPICEGTGEREWYENGGVYRRIQKCISCEGKGILWN